MPHSSLGRQLSWMAVSTASAEAETQKQALKTLGKSYSFRKREETNHVLQHINLAASQSERRIWRE